MLDLINLSFEIMHKIFDIRIIIIETLVVFNIRRMTCFRLIIRIIICQIIITIIILLCVFEILSIDFISISVVNNASFIMY